MAEANINVNQSVELTKERDRIFQVVSDDKQRRDQDNRFFRGGNLSTYTEAGIGQFIGHREKPEWKKDYQYNVFDPITRDKVYAIISKSAGLFEAEFFNTNKRLAKHSETISTILGAFYKDSTRQLDEKTKNRLSMLAALITPKTIWYEGWKYQKRTIREIEERDEFGEIKKTKEKKIVHYNGPWGELIPVQDFIPGSLKIRDLQEQPRNTWITKVQFEAFQRMFPVARFPEAKKVVPYRTLFDNDLTEYVLSSDMKENEVEIIRFFEKWDDRMSVMANGILITPINNPMPFAHKDYPFVWGGFEELSPWYVYDMPLTIKIMDMQDAGNETINLMLDMVWRALNEVVLVKDGDGINDDVLYGGGMVPVDDPTNFQKLEFGSNNGFNMANSIQDRVRRSIESSSLDAPQSGQAGARQATAREVLVAREAAMEITTLFLTSQENMERDKARLRVQNQLDRYHRPIDWQKRIGEDLTEEAQAMFREISVRGAKLDGGKRGTVNVRITKEPRPSEQLDEVNIENDKEMTQTIDVTPEFIRDIQFDVEIVPNSSIKKSKANEVAEARAFLNDAVALPQILNPRYAAEQYVEKLGKKKSEALVQEPEQGKPGMGADPMGTGAGRDVPKMTPSDDGDSIENILNQMM